MLRNKSRDLVNTRNLHPVLPPSNEGDGMKRDRDWSKRFRSMKVLESYSSLVVRLNIYSWFFRLRHKEKKKKRLSSLKPQVKLPFSSGDSEVAVFVTDKDLNTLVCRVQSVYLELRSKDSSGLVLQVTSVYEERNSIKERKEQLKRGDKSCPM